MNIIEKLNKFLNKKIAMPGDELPSVKFLPTGLTSLDLAIGGGFPKGRIVVLKGLESTAKTSLALHFIAQCQKKEISCAFIDAEYSLNIDHAKSLGVNMKDLITIKPDCGEEAFEAMEMMLREDMAKVIVVDSVSALTPQPEAESEYGKTTIGAQAKLISQGMRKISSYVEKSGAVLIFINQLRVNIMGGQWDPYTESGGMALKYYTSLAIKLSKMKTLLSGEEAVGIELKAKVTKNKVGPPFRECMLHYEFGTGWSDAERVTDLAINYGIVSRKGNSYYFNNEVIAIGRDKTDSTIEANPGLKELILSRLSQPQETQS